MRIERYEQAYEFFITPTIKYTYDKLLFGFYCIDFVWGRKGYSIQWGYKNTEKRQNKYLSI
jgi:hypothetical protein